MHILYIHKPSGTMYTCAMHTTCTRYEGTLTIDVSLQNNQLIIVPIGIHLKDLKQYNIQFLQYFQDLWSEHEPIAWFTSSSSWFFCFCNNFMITTRKNIFASHWSQRATWLPSVQVINNFLQRCFLQFIGLQPELRIRRIVPIFSFAVTLKRFHYNFKYPCVQYSLCRWCCWWCCQC